jgi:antitoxin (DNA-binding transcriptional repressor) of toxin-antitoxin stability system
MDKKETQMFQEAEKGLWKSVMGALGVASVFLTLVGNLVFSPRPASTPRLVLANKLHAPVVAQLHVTAQTPVTAQVPSAGQGPVLTPGPLADEVQTAAQGPVAEIVPVAERPQIAELLPVADIVPVTEFVPEPAPVPAGDHTAVAELTPAIDETIVIQPAERQIAVRESARDGLLAEFQPEPELRLPNDDRDERRSMIVAVEPALPVVPQILSHHDRRILRKIAHLEKKWNRLARHDRSLVGR